MSEHINHSLSSSIPPNDGEYRLPQYDKSPEWNDVNDRLEVLNIPSDPEVIAEDVLNNLADSGLSIEMTAQALHQVLVPNIESRRTDYAMNIESRDGSSKIELVSPDKRKKVFKKASQLIQDLGEQVNSGLTENFLKRAGNLMAMSVLLAHSFCDGNGRTARAVGELIRNGTTEIEDFKILIQNRPEKGYKINSYVPKNELKVASYDKVLEAVAGLEIPLGDNAAYDDYLHDKIATPYSG